MLKRIIKKILHPVISLARNYKRSKERKQLKKLVVNTHHDVSQFDKTQVADMRKHGFSLSESALFDLKRNDYHDYISTWEAYQPRFANDTYKIISDDKYLFSIVFGKFVETPISYALIEDGKIINTEYNIDESNLYQFICQHGGAVVKDRCGYNGYNVYVLRWDGQELKNNDEAIDEQKLIHIIHEYESGLIQSIIQQGQFENGIFDKSVNTIRIISMKKRDSFEHEIVCASQRIGTLKSMPVDNFSQGGGSALVDLDTGMLSSMTTSLSKDQDGKQIFYDFHPDTGAKIKGAIIPNWSKIKDSIIDLTRKFPFYEYIAWDCVVKDDGIALLEINMKSTLANIQVHGGMRNSLLGRKYREAGYLDEYVK